MGSFRQIKIEVHKERISQIDATVFDEVFVKNEGYISKPTYYDLGVINKNKINHRYLKR